WVVTERDVVRLLALNPRRTDQLRRLGLLHPAGSVEQYSFRDLVALRVARTLLDQGATVRQIRKTLETLRRLGPASEAPLAELRVTVRDGEIFIERDAMLHEPSGQIVMEFSEKGWPKRRGSPRFAGSCAPWRRPVRARWSAGSSWRPSSTATRTSGLKRWRPTSGSRRSPRTTGRPGTTWACSSTGWVVTRTPGGTTRSRSWRSRRSPKQRTTSGPCTTTSA